MKGYSWWVTFYILYFVDRASCNDSW